MPVTARKHHIVGKATALMEALMRPMDGEAIFYPFMKSGTIGMAYQIAGRSYVGIETVSLLISRTHASDCRRG